MIVSTLGDPTIWIHYFTRPPRGDIRDEVGRHDWKGTVMYCVGCGNQIPQNVSFCGACGAKAFSDAPAAAQFSLAAMDTFRSGAPLWLFLVIGGAVGAFAGYLTRPSAFLIGQLPFWTVITGGAFLQGLDQMLVPLAQQSLEQMLTGAIVGVVLGGATGAILHQTKTRTHLNGGTGT
jgi:hypothetical protein